MKTEVIGFGGGCHWCTEAVFQSIKGVVLVEQGWISSQPPNSAFSEAVRVTFDPELMYANELIEVHLLTHSCESQHSLRSRYRSAIYTREVAVAPFKQELERVALRLGLKPVTQVLPLVSFRSSPPKFLNYYQTDPGRPFCRRHIVPKIKRLQEHFPLHLKENE